MCALKTWPEFFVDVGNALPLVVPALHYVGHTNFLGRPVKGYGAPRMLLTQAATDALAKAAAFADQEGFRLVVYDAYRPCKAVLDFVSWGQQEEDAATKGLYYPSFSKQDLFTKGYIAKASAHSRGSTVDLTLLEKDKVSQFDSRQFQQVSYTLRDGRQIVRIDDGTLGMGGHFDLFDLSSHPDSNLVDDVSQKHRDLLASMMAQAGFLPFAQEWWHFTLKEEPFPDTSFDFDID